MTKQRFTNRFILVTETNSIAKGVGFSYRTYTVRADADTAARTAAKRAGQFSGKRYYVVDRDNMGHVILP
jgi:hypothetical protein